MARRGFVLLHPNRNHEFDSLKNAYLLYDEITLSDVDHFIFAQRSASGLGKERIALELERIIDKNIFNIAKTPTEKDIENLAKKDNNFRRICLDTTKVYLKYDSEVKRHTNAIKNNEDQGDLLINNFELLMQYEHLREKLFSEYYSITTGEQYSPIRNNSYSTGVLDRSEVIELVINKFPVVDSKENWEKIIEFKNDDSTRLNYLRFREFTKNLSDKNLTANEVEEEIEYLIEEYKNHMNHAQLMYKNGHRKALFLTSLKFTENLLRLKLSDAFNSLYSIKEKRLELLEAEKKAPGKEVALLVKSIDSNE